METNEPKSKRRRRTRDEIDELLAAYKEAGITQSEFCRERGLSLATFGSWLRKSRTDAEVAPGGFCEVRLREGTMMESTAIRLADGTEVFLPGPLPPVRLGEYVSALRRSC